MKAFLTLALFQIVAFVNCGIYKTTDLGKKGEEDILIYTATVSVYKTLLDPFEQVSFPPKGLIKNYNINYVKVLDYNRSPAEAFIYNGHIGGHEITVALKAPVLKRIEAIVEIYGTFNGPCANTDKAEEGSNAKKPEQEKNEQYVFTN